jgi:hypothetical protein
MLVSHAWEVDGWTYSVGAAKRTTSPAILLTSSYSDVNLKVGPK